MPSSPNEIHAVSTQREAYLHELINRAAILRNELIDTLDNDELDATFRAEKAASVVRTLKSITRTIASIATTLDADTLVLIGLVSKLPGPGGEE